MEYDLTQPDGFEAMYREYFPKIYNYVFYRLMRKEDTEDVVSDIFFKVAQNGARYDPKKSKFSTWIYAIANNALIDFYRKRKAAVSLDDEEAGVVLKVDFETQLAQISSPKRQALFEELATLKERERLIVYYRFFEGYTNRQIGELLQMNESTVGTVLSRTLKKLQRDSLRDL